LFRERLHANQSNAGMETIMKSNISHSIFNHQNIIVEDMTSHIRKEATCPSHRVISLTAQTKAKHPTQHVKLMSNPQHTFNTYIEYKSMLHLVS